MWKRFSQIRFVPLIASLVMFFLVFQIGGKTFIEWQNWNEIARNQVETEAAVINKMKTISGSGSVTKYDITQEFVAPAAAGGSNYSRTELDEKLKENFFKQPEDNNEIKVSEQRNDGNQYFSRTQPVEPEIVNAQLNGNSLQIVYAKNNPQNSMIKGTGSYPVLWIILLSGLLILGGYLLFLSLRPAFRSKI